MNLQHLHIREVFDRLAILSEEEWQIFASKLFNKRYAKGEFLLREGEIENQLKFIIEGTVRLFTSGNKQEDISLGFASEGTFCSAYASFVMRSPSKIGIEALESVEVLCVSYDDLQMLYSYSHTGERLGRINAEMYLSHKEDREILLLTMSAKERYLDLMNRNPRLFELVKLEHIATFLGITPQSLSRIRKDIRET